MRRKYVKTVEWSSKDLLKLISLYKKQEILWKNQADIYKGKPGRYEIAKTSALRKIVSAMKVYLPKLTISHVKLKLASLRLKYKKCAAELENLKSFDKKELLEIRDHRYSDFNVSDRDYKPYRYWWFDALSFLGDQNKSKDVQASSLNDSDTELENGEIEDNSDSNPDERTDIMEEDNSNDVEAVEYIDSQDEDDPDEAERRPIMLLLRRLIRNKQNTVMTNSQIIDILQSEFGVLVKSSHELEVDIYIKIIKKYLKDWPQWEELERISTKLKNVNDFDAVTKVLDHKYKNLKEYLGVMLDAAKPLAKEAVKNYETEKKAAKEAFEKSDVVMEVECSRDQLLQLFFRRPRPDLDNSIFNIVKYEPTRNSPMSLDLKQILNFWWLKVYITLPYLTFTREINHYLKHTLVNKARNDDSVLNKVLDQDVMIQIQPRTLKCEVKKEVIIEMFRKIIKLSNDNKLLKTVFEVCETDVNNMVDFYKIPASYKRNANKYMYIRYLYVDDGQHEDSSYDFQLQETVSPAYQMYFGKVTNFYGTLPPLDEWFRMECILCKMSFIGSLQSNLEQKVTQHYNDTHYNESDWQCTNCRKIFDMKQLVENHWHHECWE